VVLLYFFWPELGDKVSILYLALVSIYALVITAAGGNRWRKPHKTRTTTRGHLRLDCRP